MSDITQDLAQKVISADLRNVIKKVGEGGTLSEGERTLFLDFAKGQAPEDMHAARIDALLKKWLHGGRLTESERAEIAHILPPLRTIDVKSYEEGSAEENAKRIGLTRRPFFVWKAKGEKHNDPLPFTEPPQVPAWYQRMKERGEFKHRCPDTVLAAARASVPVTRAVTAPSSFESSLPGLPPPRRESSELQSLRFEAEDIQRHLERLREETEKLFSEKTPESKDEANRILSSRVTLLGQLSLILKRITDQEEREGALVNTDGVANDLATVYQSVIQWWMNEGSNAHRDLQSALPRAEFIKRWSGVVTEVCRGLSRSKFAPPPPPLELESAA